MGFEDAEALTKFAIELYQRHPDQPQFLKLKLMTNYAYASWDENKLGIEDVAIIKSDFDSLLRNTKSAQEKVDVISAFGDISSPYPGHLQDFYHSEGQKLLADPQLAFSGNYYLYKSIMYEVLAKGISPIELDGSESGNASDENTTEEAIMLGQQYHQYIQGMKNGNGNPLFVDPRESNNKFREKILRDLAEVALLGDKAKLVGNSQFQLKE